MTCKKLLAGGFDSLSKRSLSRHGIQEQSHRLLFWQAICAFEHYLLVSPVLWSTSFALDFLARLGPILLGPTSLFLVGYLMVIRPYRDYNDPDYLLWAFRIVLGFTLIAFWWGIFNLFPGLRSDLIDNFSLGVGTLGSAWGLQVIMRRNPEEKATENPTCSQEATIDQVWLQIRTRKFVTIHLSYKAVTALTVETTKYPSGVYSWCPWSPGGVLTLLLCCTQEHSGSSTLEVLGRHKMRMTGSSILS